MNFYWIKLDLARLKLTGNPEAKYIHFIFLNPRKDQYLSKEICFIFFWFQNNPVQNLQLCSRFERLQKLETDKANGLIPAACCTGLGPACTVPGVACFCRGARPMATLSQLHGSPSHIVQARTRPARWDARRTTAALGTLSGGGVGAETTVQWRTAQGHVGLTGEWSRGGEGSR
jgi:hypothetical protein